MKVLNPWLALLCWSVLLCSGFVAADAQDQKSEQKTVLLMMSGHTASAKGNMLKQLAEDQPFSLETFQGQGKSLEEVEARWSEADLILLDGINPALSKFMFAKYQPLLSKVRGIPVVSLGDADNKAMNRGLNQEQHQRVVAYYNNAGRENYRNLMRYLSAAVFADAGSVSVPEPVEVPLVGLYHPQFDGQITDNEERFFDWIGARGASKQPLIAMAIHRSVVDYEQQQVVDYLINGLEEKGAGAFAFFFEGEDLPMNYPELLKDGDGNTRPQLLINYRTLHYVEKRRSEFTQLGVPVIHALNYGEGDEQAFGEDNTGVSPGLTPFFLVMPEDTGSTDPVVIAATEAGNKKVMTAQADALVERAYNHAKLALKPNAEKKIVTFIWNYPPGEKNIGAAFLDVPSSIEQIANRLVREGYGVEPKASSELIESAGKLLRPYYRGEDSEGLIEQGLADYLPLSVYRAWFDQLPEYVRNPIIDRWGEPDANGMVVEHRGQPHFVIPRMDLGNMIVLPQGVRGDNAEESAALYHSTKTPVNHSYLAIYRYAIEKFGADAFIHLGTHGSQEWLTGKERGLSVYDAPNLAVQNIPVFYPYIIDNVGEAMQAKRRGRATMLSHLTPGFAKAGLYAEVAALNELIGNYLMLDEGQTKANTRSKIIEQSETLNILTDLSIDAASMESGFDDNLSRIQDHLQQLAEMSQPLGVHTYGVLPKDAHLYSTMLQMLGDEFVERAREYEQENGLALAPDLRTGKNDVVELEALDGFQLLRAYLSGASLEGLSEELRNDLKQAREYWDNFQDIAELDNLMLALSAGYIPVSYGGDPIRNPQAAPTGRNLIGFNPAKVPSKEAYAAGVSLMNQTIEDYVAKHGRYPDKLAFSLWSLETMRHQGVLEAQILHALGIKPVWNQQGNVVDTEIIPYAELGRPRIDVVISATGLYRDAFPNVMLWLAEAIDKIANLKEENNSIYRHSAALKQQLLAEGKSQEDAEYLSSLRIFSNETGNYGTGLAGASLASDTWEDDSKLADLYLRRMGFAYGKDESRWSENVSDTGLYGKVLSGTDGVIFSRSTNLYALLTNDDPFQYFGGIGMAVRSLDGATPEMYVSNLRRKDNIKAQTMDEFLNQEMRSRYFHPRWIEAMQESGYAGATAILDRMNNMWGWEVMTPEAVRDDHWQEFFEVYVEDKYELEMQAFFEEHNAEALAQILERMLEAVRKDYWQADEQTLKKMLEAYSDLANRYDVHTNNEAFKEYVNTQAQGFGLAPLPVPSDAAAVAAPASAATQQVQGQKLEQVEQTAKEKDWDTMLLGSLFFCLLTVLAGMLIQMRPQSIPRSAI